MGDAAGPAPRCQQVGELGGDRRAQLALGDPVFVDVAQRVGDRFGGHPHGVGRREGGLAELGSEGGETVAGVVIGERPQRVGQVEQFTGSMPVGCTAVRPGRPEARRIEAGFEASGQRDGSPLWAGELDAEIQHGQIYRRADGPVELVPAGPVGQHLRPVNLGHAPVVLSRSGPCWRTRCSGSGRRGEPCRWGRSGAWPR